MAEAEQDLVGEWLDYYFNLRNYHSPRHHQLPRHNLLPRLHGPPLLLQAQHHLQELEEHKEHRGCSQTDGAVTVTEQ